jgi:hypothetical protein
MPSAWDQANAKLEGWRSRRSRICARMGNVPNGQCEDGPTAFSPKHRGLLRQAALSVHLAASAQVRRATVRPVGYLSRVEATRLIASVSSPSAAVRWSAIARRIGAASSRPQTATSQRRTTLQMASMSSALPHAGLCHPALRTFPAQNQCFVTEMIELSPQRYRLRVATRWDKKKGGLMPNRLLPLARQRIRDKGLPACLPERTFGGVSQGGTCALCREPIERNSMDIETEGASVLLFHPACYSAWTAVIREGSAQNV